MNHCSIIPLELCGITLIFDVCLILLAMAITRRCTCIWWTWWAPSSVKATLFLRSCWIQCWSTWCPHTRYKNVQIPVWDSWSECLKSKLLINGEESEAMLFSIPCNSLRPLQAKWGTATCWSQTNGKTRNDCHQPFCCFFYHVLLFPPVK